MDHMLHSTSRALPAFLTLLAATASAPSTASAQLRFNGLGILPNSDWSGASLLSTDGNTIVGSGGLNSGDPAGARIFLWTPLSPIGGGMFDAAPTSVLPQPALPFAMSANGNILVGDYSVNGVTRGYRLHIQTQTLDILSAPSSTRTTATVVSDDGNTVGLYCAGCTGSRAFLWTPNVGGQYTPIPLPIGVTTGWLEPRAMNPDGSIVVGSLRLSQSSPLFRWTAATGTVLLNMIPEAALVQPFGISDDGRTIVGDFVTTTNQRLAFRWREGIGGESLIPMGPGGSSRALDVSADGSAIVGSFGTIGSAQAYLWTQQRGVVLVADELFDHGIDLSLLGWTLSATAAITPDGLTVAGDGFHNGVSEAWSAIIGSRCIADFDDGSGTGTPDGGVTLDDLLYYLDLYEQGVTRADIDDGTLSGTHDGGVTIEDLLYYLLRYDAGC